MNLKKIVTNKRLCHENFRVNAPKHLHQNFYGTQYKVSKNSENLNGLSICRFFTAAYCTHGKQSIMFSFSINALVFLLLPISDARIRALDIEHYSICISLSLSKWLTKPINRSFTWCHCAQTHTFLLFMLQCYYLILLSRRVLSFTIDAIVFHINYFYFFHEIQLNTWLECH